MKQSDKLLAIVGETATGKTGLAVKIAKRFAGEIINADSWQIYKDMDIGTAKLDQQVQAEIPHHLLDIVSPDQEFTAAEYKDLALEAIDDISRRGKLPILVGGTGLYVDSVLFDYSFAPPGGPGLRQELNQKDIPTLIRMVNRRGFDLSGIDTRNKRRLIRLLETDGARPSRSQLRSNTLMIGILVASRSQLRHSIEKRVEVMFRRGLKHEVRELAEKYGWEIEAMKGIGYREFKPYFDGVQSLTETKHKIVKSTLDLAKRQRTWLKRNRDIKWFENEKKILKHIERFMNN